MNKIIKQHDNANYSKEQNDVEKYIMKIIQRYFLVEQEYSENQIESIIVEAIRRVKIYLADHQAGVFAVNHKTGDVHLDITDFDGEPAFDKNTAFNKDFGNEGDTICEGNDYRLSNPREPLPHTHYVDEIPGLEDLLYDRYGLIFISHVHRDKEAIEKIIYTGTQPEIDLILIEQFMEMVVMFIVQIKNIEITAENIKKDFSDFIDSIEPKINDIITMYSEFLSEQPWVEAARKYTNDKKNSFVNKYTEMLKSYITYDRMVELTYGLGLPIYETGYFNFNPTEEVKFCKLEENITDKFDISAKVYDDNTGLPLENVEVKLDNSTTKTTSSTGAYAFDNVLQGEHIITFNKHNYYDDKMYTFITSDHTNIEDVYMRPIIVDLGVNVFYTAVPLKVNTFYSVADIIVIVRESGTSTAIPDAEVRLLEFTGITDSNGQYTFSNMYSGNTYAVTASHQEYRNKTESVELNSSTSITKTILLDPITYVLTVRVKEKDSNNNLASAVATLTMDGTGTVKTASTNSDGVATFDIRQNKSYKLKVTKSNYETQDNISIPGGTSDQTVNITLKHNPITITFSVTSEETSPNNNVSGAVIQISGDSNTYTTGSNGKVSATIDLYKEYTFTATLPSGNTYSTTDYPVRSMSETKIFDNPSLSTATQLFAFKAKLYDINITVKDDLGNIITNQPVRLGGRTTNTDTNGVATFQYRGNNTYLASITRTGFIAVTNQKIVVSNSNKNVTIQLEPVTTTLNVTVKNTNGDTLSGVTFTFKNVTDNTTEEITSVTSADGLRTFTLRGGKSYKITAHRSKYKDKELAIAASNTAVQTVNRDIVMEYCNIITGYVKNTRTNEGISGATVTVSLSGKDAVTTDENGMFTFEDIKTGTYTFTATHASYESSDNTLTGISIDINNDKEVGTIMLTPLLADNTYEFHDEWTQQGKDLDMHLFGQIEGQDVHVYYSNKHEGNVHLDVDAQGSQASGFAENGTFTFSTINDYMEIWIHDYNNRSSTTTDMQNSGLKYRLKMGKNTIGPYTRPTNGVVLSRDVPSNPSNTGPWLYVGKIMPNGFIASNTYKESRT